MIILTFKKYFNQFVSWQSVERDLFVVTNFLHNLTSLGLLLFSSDFSSMSDTWIAHFMFTK